MCAKQAFNPYLPSYEYIPDAEPYVVDGRVYIYGSHDIFNGLSFCMGDYVCWSASVDSLGDWRYEGTIFRREQDPASKGRISVACGMAAPDMQRGLDGRFYLYYFIGGTKMISVAVSDRAGGPYEFYGYVHYPDGTPIGKRGEPYQFDPAVFLDDDGRLYLYTGFALTTNPILLRDNKPTLHGPMCFELDPRDMLTVKVGPRYLGIPGKKEARGTPYAEHVFLEASSMRKFDGKYYFIYSSQKSHELCYAVSRYPDRDFSFGGVLVSNGDIGLAGVPDTRHARACTGNTHGSILKLGEEYYIFYHRHSNRKQSSRQACAEKLRFENGKFYQSEMTSCGLNGAPLAGEGTYPAYIACNLYGRFGTHFLSMIKLPKFGTPYLTQTGGDRESGDDQYIANFCHGAVAGFKYFDLRSTRRIRVHLRGNARGTLTVRTAEHTPPITTIPITAHGDTIFFADIQPQKEKTPLFFCYHGKGSFDFLDFTLEK